MNPYYRIKRWIEDIWYNFRGRCQRFKRGYAYGDVWDMDFWFRRTVKPMLIHLRDYGNSFPMEFDNREEWCAVLNEMISCLYFMEEDNVRNFLGFGGLGGYKKMNQKDYAHVGEIMNNNKDKFFRLFSKYFYSLWD